MGYSPRGRKESDMTEHMRRFIYLYMDYLRATSATDLQHSLKGVQGGVVYSVPHII